MNYEIAERIRGLREIAEKTAEKVAEDLKVSLETYLNYETGRQDAPMGFLMDLSHYYNVEMTDLLMGGAPMLHTFSFVKQGRGILVERMEEYKYQHLAYNFAGRKAEPFLVTVENQPDEEIHLNAHEGQEFNYCVEGELQLIVDGREIRMEPGDSLYFDSQKPHGMRALNGKTAKLIAIIFS